jgi:sugar lactone lactonase YvrE
VKRFHAVPATDERYVLGEGPFWDAARARVLWVDIAAGHVYSGTFGSGRVNPELLLTLPGTVGAVVSSAGGELLVAGPDRLYTVSPQGSVTHGVRILGAGTASRLNDGGCDPAGRFLVGSLALDSRAGEEVLVRVEDDGSVRVLDDDLGLSNGLAFAPGGAVLYSVDTAAGIVWMRDYDSASGDVGERREFLRLDAKPDGLCVDVDGNLWIAIWGAAQVRCYSTAGEQVGVVDVAAPNTTSVAFMGQALDTLLITTASEQLSDEQLARYPDSGRLFIADVGVSGLPVPGWAGSNTVDSA